MEPEPSQTVSRFPDAMSTRTFRPGAKAFARKDLLVVLAVIGVLMLFLLGSFNRARMRAQRICCNCHLKQVGLSFRQWALDHSERNPMQVSVTNGGTMELVESGIVFPHFLVMSNELNTPIILRCPVDKKRTAAVSFTNKLSDTNVSYFVGADADDRQPQMFLAGDRNITNHLGFRSGMLVLATNELAGWTHHLHNRQGNVGLADGSVQGFSTSKLREALQNTGVATNRLAMP